MSDDWFSEASVVSCARLRIFCFHHAGGGSAVFRRWQRELPAAIDLRIVRLPGRESRAGVPPATRLLPVVDRLALAMAPLVDLPFAFFGHSLGALIAFELTRALEQRGAPGPLRLFVAARRAPHLRDPAPPLHQRSDAELIAAVRQRYGGIPAPILAEPELLALLLPALRADFEMLETYRFEPADPVAAPVRAFGGLDDRQVTRDDLEAWRSLTRGSFGLRLFPGGHFFPHDSPGSVVAAIVDELHAAAGTAVVESRVPR